MEPLDVLLTGVTPLLMHNGQLANPFNPIAIEMKKLTSKRKKTEEDQTELYWLEWQGALYLDAEDAPHIPADNLLSFINDGARRCRRGPDVYRGVNVPESTPLVTDWPARKTLRQIFELGTFCDVRPQPNPSTGNRVMRCRVILRTWSARFTLLSDPEILDRRDLAHWLELAGKYCGLMDMRPTYGRCSVQILNQIEREEKDEEAA